MPCSLVDRGYFWLQLIEIEEATQWTLHGYHAADGVADEVAVWIEGARRFGTRRRWLRHQGEHGDPQG